MSWQVKGINKPKEFGRKHHYSIIFRLWEQGNYPTCDSILTGSGGCIHYLYLSLLFKGFKIAHKKFYETKF